MAFVISSLAGALLEIDEIEAARIGDEVHYTFLTTGVLPSLAELKTKLWAYIAPPVKRLQVVSIEPIEQGPITKRYKIKVVGKSLGRTIGTKEYRLLPLKSRRL